MNACVKAHEAFNYDKLSLYMTHKLASELFLLFLKEKKKLLLCNVHRIAKWQRRDEFVE